MRSLRLTRFSAAVALCASLAIVPAPAAAADVIYDAFTSFNGTQLNGGFAYISVPLTGGAFTALSNGGAGCVIAGSICLQTPGVGFPGAYKSANAFTALGTIAVPNNRLVLIPSAQAQIIAVFVAPVSATYSYVASFNILDSRPTGVGLFKVDGSTGTSVATGLGAINGTTRSQSFAGTVALAAGRSFSFGINPLVNPSGDSVGFNYTLSRAVAGVPEPTTWAMMIFGFGIVGSALRRRKALRLRPAV